MLPNDFMSKIQCGQLHSELFGRTHSTLSSEQTVVALSLALAKRLYCILLGIYWQSL